MVVLMKFLAVRTSCVEKISSNFNKTRSPGIRIIGISQMVFNLVWYILS